MVLIALAYMVFYWAVPARALDVEIVTPDTLSGWEIHDNENPCTGSTDNTAQILFVPGPAPIPRGRGSLQFLIGPNGNSRAYIQTERFASLNLEEITASDGRLSYSAIVQSPGTDDLDEERAPWLALVVDRDNNGTEDDILVYEPRFNSGVTTGTWSDYNVKSSTARWWSTTDREAETGATQQSRQTLIQYRARFPLAEVLYLRIGAGAIENNPEDGCGSTGTPPSPPAWTGFSGNIDVNRVKMFTHDVVFDFEPEGTDQEPSEGSPVPTFTRTRSASPSSSTSSPGTSPSTSSSTSPGPTNTGGDGRCPAEPGQNRIVGTNRGETLRGTSGDDVICSFGGDDLVSGRGGDDEIRLGAGSDRGLGEGGWDDIFGARGRDNLKGGAGSDDLVGGPGRDTCVGGPGRDRFSSCERRRR
jgi:hypothetical protein